MKFQHIGEFNFPRLADFGAAISGANKFLCQQVLEELDVSKKLLCSHLFEMIRLDVELFYHVTIFEQVYKRLKLTLELVKKEMEISKLQVELNISLTKFYLPYLLSFITDFC
jgi:ATP-dependent Lon protease